LWCNLPWNASTMGQESWTLEDGERHQRNGAFVQWVMKIAAKESGYRDGETVQQMQDRLYHDLHRKYGSNIWKHLRDIYELKYESGFKPATLKLEE